MSEILEIITRFLIIWLAILFIVQFILGNYDEAIINLLLIILNNLSLKDLEEK